MEEMADSKRKAPIPVNSKDATMELLWTSVKMIPLHTTDLLMGSMKAGLAFGKTELYPGHTTAGSIAI